MELVNCYNTSYINGCSTINISDNTTSLSDLIEESNGLTETVIAILALLAGITSFTTVIGNLIVVISFSMEKSIRTPSNYLIVSLAITDILIGSSSMPLYTMYLLMNYWPLGTVVCDLWLSIDYTVCLVSQYTVFLITMDRFCSVKAPTKYRNWRTPTKMKLMIAATWLVPAAIFFTSIMGWHVFVPSSEKRDTEQCMAMFQSNHLFSAILVICYYWVTLFVMIGLYAGIYQVALALHKKSNAARKRIDMMSQSIKQTSTVSKENEKLLSSPDATPSTQTNSSDYSKKSAGKESGHSPKLNGSRAPLKPSVPQLDHQLKLPEIKIDRPPPPQTLAVDGNHNEKSCASLDGMRSLANGDDGSPVWKPRGSLPNTSIHWNAFTGNTFHTINKEDLTDESTKDMSGSANVSPRLSDKRPARRKKRSQRDSGRSAYDSDEDEDDSSDGDNKTGKVINQLSSMVAFLATSPRRVERKKGSTHKKAQKSENRARKALRTITFILGAFVICWTPYHVIVLVASFCTNCKINPQFYQFSYWLCYMNSPFNPFCYAFSNPQFKKSFIKTLKFEYFRKCKFKLCSSS